MLIRWDNRQNTLQLINIGGDGGDWWGLFPYAHDENTVAQGEATLSISTGDVAGNPPPMPTIPTNLREPQRTAWYSGAAPATRLVPGIISH